MSCDMSCKLDENMVEQSWASLFIGTISICPHYRAYRILARIGVSSIAKGGYQSRTRII